ncbi:RluA family pseudouridine synthase [Massilia sp. CF038]|uniref:RluA family pseudouridine synthase n=1 Tax=Massilia sp. CF038 TaxID=1881045 RepID=UPI001E40A768|nr:RluA family pseudouridine synthase [Massilia sp. CF038]
MRDGVAPSYLWIDDTAPAAALPFLVARFPDIGEAVWRDRMARHDVVDGTGAVLGPNSTLRRGTRIWYYREIEAETPIPFEEQILFQDAHLLVVDKPHFLPTTPGGRFLHESLLVRLKNKLGIAQLTPIHRLDRETAGVVVFSLREESRGAYQSLFQKRSVDKVYEALAAPLPGRTFPFTHVSRMVEGTPFFRMQEEAGEPNSETRIEVIEERGALALYRLHPRTGRKHQLRVHMMSIGAPILNDTFYPEALPQGADDFANPLKLLARAIAFDDPLTGQRRRFESARTL